MARAPHAKLNQGTQAGAARAADHLPALTRAYARALRAGGRRAARRFRQVEVVTAAAQPDAPPPGWIIPPTPTIIDQQELAQDTNKKTSRLHRVILAASAGETAQAIGTRFDITAPVTQTILDAYAARITETIGSAIAEQVTEAIQAGYAAGSSVAQVSTMIQQAVDAISPVRADMLARSDLNGLSNAGSHLVASMSGAAKTKTWLATEDDRTREDHADADGQTVGISDTFDVGGESLRYPGDPNGSWAETANCRCTLTYGTSLTASGEVSEPAALESPSLPQGPGLGSVRKADPGAGSLTSSTTPGILYLARHGLTEYDSDDHAKDTIRGWADDPLNDEGVAEAKRLADNLDGHAITSVLASDLQRAAKTADIIVDKTGVKLDMTMALRPWNLGDFQGRTSDDARDDLMAYVDNPDECVPGGESFQDFCSRFLPVVADAMSHAEQGGSPLLVTHSHNLKLARAWIVNGRKSVTGEQFMEPSPGPASVLAVDPAAGWSVTEILCDGDPPDEAGRVPARVHYRPASTDVEMCGTCAFYPRPGYCSMFEAEVIPDYTCDEFVAKSTGAVTSGGNMNDFRLFREAMGPGAEIGIVSPGRFEVERLTSAERDALRALLDAPLTPEQARLSAARDALAAKGVGGVYDDDEITALFAILDAGRPWVSDAASETDLTAAAAGGTPWTATLCVADEPTVDSGMKRILASGGGSWLPLPLPLALLDDSPHAEMTTKAPVVGRIDQIWWAGNVCQASGVFFDDSDDPTLAQQASKAAALVGEMRRMGISVDLVDTEVEMCAWGDSGEIPMDSANDPTAREMDDMVDPNAPGGPATEANLPNDIPEMEDEAEEYELAYIFRQWVVAGATICPVQALTQATISLVASGFTAADRYRWFCWTRLGVGALTASAAGLAPVKPPAEWFTEPEHDEPTPLTVTDAGQVYGHMALWNSCHTGFQDRCVPPPKSPSDYSGFHLGELPVADGSRIQVGTLTMDTGHANLRMSADRAVAHYDDTGTAAAYVRATDGKHGIWVCGALSARLAAEEAQAFMAAKPSGDWRQIFRDKGRDMIGALMVNVPGFIVPRTLTAAGMPYGDLSVEFATECTPCEESLARELVVLAASVDGIEGLAALVS